MNRGDFTAQAYGKWILAGEHAVLRGCPALVFPLLSRALTLKYMHRDQALELELVGEHGHELQLLVWGVLEKACEILKVPRSDLQGKVVLESSIPVGAGMGASAALCVAITRWLGHLGYVAEGDYYEFARNLENLFHGESSGVDVAVALSGEGLYFTRGGQREKFVFDWQPQWYVSYSGQRGVTAACVEKVKALIAQDPQKGAQIDEEMRQSVLSCMQSLEARDMEGLVLAINRARQCFEQWGLTEGAPEAHMSDLIAAGAIAVKPTGSGGGGYVLSLWKASPPREFQSVLIPC